MVSAPTTLTYPLTGDSMLFADFQEFGFSPSGTPETKFDDLA